MTMQSARIRILVVEDNPGDVNLLTEMLRWSETAGAFPPFDLVQSGLLSQSLDLLNNESIDLIILDLSLPDSHGIDTFHKINACAGDIPIIVLTGNEQENLGLETVKSGAQDYLLKGHADRRLLVSTLLYSMERHQLRKNLNRSNQLLTSMLERNADGILIVDQESRVRFINPSAESLLNRKRQEILGESIWFPLNPMEPVVVYFERPGTDEGVQAELLAEDIEWEENPATLVSLRDITAHIKENEELERRVEERTRELKISNLNLQSEIQGRENLEGQLRQSQKLEAIGRLAGGIAHDFNNMLMSIQLSSRKLLDGFSKNAKMQLSLGEILKTTHRAAAITKQLLAIGRRQILEPKYLDLNLEIRDAGHMLRHLIGENIQLVIEPESHGTVKVDPGQLQQVILNLALNARDAMPRGGRILLSSSSKKLEAELIEGGASIPVGHYICLKVEDNGEGMDEGTLENIFEPFFTTKAVGEGTGLGLATVHGIVKQSGGHVIVLSTPSQGTRFQIFFPEVTQPKSEDPLEALENPITSPGTGTILLVEDEGALRRLLRETLEESGYEVLEAEDGGRALEIGEGYTGQIDLLITDVVMPGISGHECAQKFKELYPEVRILYISGYTDDVLLRHGVLEEGFSYIQKPFTPATLIPRIKKLLDSEPFQNDER
jgi:signal transduction histidine kinase